MVLYDWQRGKIPFYTLPPDYTELPPGAAAAAADTLTAADAAAEGDEQQQEGGGGPAAAAAGGMFTAAVTEDDAAAEAGARPENAAAAAAALRDAAATALRRQRRGAIPIKEGYYLPDDEKGTVGEGGDVQQGSEDAISEDEVSQDLSDGSGSDEDAADSGSEDAAAESSEEDPGSSSGGEDDAAAAAEEQPQQRQRKRARKADAAAAAAVDSGDESDGYGDAGLSWEAVLQAVQVRQGRASSVLFLAVFLRLVGRCVCCPVCVPSPVGCISCCHLGWGLRLWHASACVCVCGTLCGKFCKCCFAALDGHSSVLARMAYVSFGV
jgi:nuclear GTP-binding protein